MKRSYCSDELKNEVWLLFPNHLDLQTALDAELTDAQKILGQILTEKKGKIQQLEIELGKIFQVYLKVQMLKKIC